MYLRRPDQFEKQPRTSSGQGARIARSFKALLIHVYKQQGLVGALKNIVGTVLNADVVLLTTRPGLEPLLQSYPDLLNGSLSHPYLATSFNKSRRTRYDIFVSHYRYMASRLKETFYEEVRDCDLILWSSTIEGEELRNQHIF